MFDVGFWELAIIAMVALLVVGPERLPGMARTAGKWMGRMRRLARELRMELEREVDVRGELQKLRDDTIDNKSQTSMQDLDNVLAGSVDVDPPEPKA